jgi:hypothetical protein
MTLTRMRPIFVMAVVGIGFAALSAPTAGAATRHLFQRAISIKVVNSAGHPVNPSAPPGAGDRSDEIDGIYAGTAAHHSKSPVGFDHLGCFVMKFPKPVVCDLSLTLGSSMLLSDEFVVSFGSAYPFKRIPIRDGTGNFAHAHGHMSSSPIGTSNNSNLTLVF